MSNPDLLMVTYFAPPAATGVRRLVSLARDLPEHGWHPIIVCCNHSAGMGWDESPFADPRIAAIPIVRTESRDPYRLMERWRSRKRDPNAPRVKSAASTTGAGGASRAIMSLLRRHVFVPDDRQGWIRHAVRAGIEAAAKHPIRAIYSSNYPQSAHIAALEIKKATGLPWLADFRDGWTQNPAFHDPGNSIVREAQIRAEFEVVRSADQVVTVSPPITRHLQTLRAPASSPVETIFNGFDPVGSVGHEAPLNPGMVTVLYTGTFFGPRRPDEFFHTLAATLAGRPELAAKVRVRLRCVIDEDAHGLLQQLELREIVEVLPPVGFAEIQREQRKADGFLLILERGPGAEIMVSQKVFEYLGASRPIFAMIPEGAAEEVLVETGGATIATSPDRREVASQFEAYLDRLLSGTHPVADPGRLAQFERREQSRRMAGLLDLIASNSKG